MKKLLYILFIVLLSGSCSEKKSFSKTFSKYSILNTEVFNSFENYYWEGIDNNNSYKLLIEELVKVFEDKDIRVYQGTMYFNTDTLSLTIEEDYSDDFCYATVLNKVKPFESFFFHFSSNDSLYLKFSNQRIYGRYTPLVKRVNEMYKPFSIVNIVPNLGSSVTFDFNDIFQENWTITSLYNGSTIFAIKSGKVVEIEKRHGRKKLVVIKHENGRCSAYSSYYQQLFIKEGNEVKKVQKIGIVGERKEEKVSLHFSYLEPTQD